MLQRLLLVITILVVARMATFVVLGNSSPSQSLGSLPTSALPQSSAPFTADASQADPAALPTDMATRFRAAEAPGDEAEWQELEPFDLPIEQSLAPDAEVDPEADPIWGRRGDRPPKTEPDWQNPVASAEPWAQVPDVPRSPDLPSDSWAQPSVPVPSVPVPSVPVAPGDARMTDVCDAIRSAVVTVRVGRDVGSGSIVRSQGLVLTNYHVIRRSRDQQVRIQTQAGQSYLGRVIASDRPNDLALIQLEPTESLPTVRLATSEPPTGQAVCAIGSPFGAAGTITTGRLVRILANGDLQSDVELHPGNSGGPLVNAQGEMIGVNKGVARSRRRSPRAALEGDDTGSGTPRRSYATNATVAAAFIRQHSAHQSF